MKFDGESSPKYERVIEVIKAHENQPLPIEIERGGETRSVTVTPRLDDGWARLGPTVGVQGNLDPTLLFAPRDRLLAQVDDVLRRAGGRRGHVFNLGHGILPTTPVESVKAVVDHVHARTEEGARS